MIEVVAYIIKPTTAEAIVTCSLVDPHPYNDGMAQVLFITGSHTPTTVFAMPGNHREVRIKCESLFGSVNITNLVIMLNIVNQFES